MSESRRERERVLADYRKQADEKKEFKEKVEKRVRHYLTIKTICHWVTCHPPAPQVIHPPLQWTEYVDHSQ